MKLLDINILVAAHREDVEQHQTIHSAVTGIPVS